MTPEEPPRAGSVVTRAAELIAAPLDLPSVLDRLTLLAQEVIGAARGVALLDPGIVPSVAPDSISAALTGRDGERIGVLQVAAPFEGDFDDADVATLSDLAAVASTVIENARLYAAERLARQRLENLQSFTAALAGARTADDVSRLAVAAGAAALGGQTGSICLLDGDELVLVTEQGYQADTKRDWRRFPLAAPLPAGDAVRSGRPVFLRSIADRDLRYPQFAATAAADEAFAIVPMFGERGAVGALTIGFPEQRDFTYDDEQFLLALGRQCAQALERARLADAERANAATQTLLAEAALVLSSSLVPEETVNGLVRLVVPRVADWAVVYLLGDEGPTAASVQHIDLDAAAAVRTLAVRGELAAVVAGNADGKLHEMPEGGIDALGLDDTVVAALLRQSRVTTWVSVPLLAGARQIGLLAAGTAEGGRESMSPEELAVVRELAARGAVAIENALAHEARIHLAETLQTTLLPPTVPDIEGLEVAVRYRPVGGGIIGGDFYDVFGADGRWIVVIGDVCGKGPEAAAVTALVRYTIRTAALLDTSPSSILRMCNGAVLDAGIGERFATVAVAAICTDEDGAGVTLACGGHPSPVVRRADGSIEIPDAAGTAVGLFPGGDYTDVELRLGPGDALVGFTDGLLEARSPSGEFAPRLLDQVLRATAGSTPDRTVDALLAALDAFEAGTPRDDLALLVARVPPLPAPPATYRMPLPAASLVAVDEYLAELQRELELVRLARRHARADQAHPQRLLVVLAELLDRYADVRAGVRDQAEEAVAAGRAEFVAELRGDGGLAAGALVLVELLAEIGAYARDGQLLTLPPGPGTLAPLEGFLQQLRLVEGPATGREPSVSVPTAVPDAMDDARRLRTTIPLSDHMAREARRLVTATLNGWGAPDEADRLALAVNELVVNCQIHARSPVELALSLDAQRCRVEIGDRSPLLPARRTHAEAAGTGRGLVLVEDAVDRWGVQAAPGGKTVWVEIDRAG